MRIAPVFAAVGIAVSLPGIYLAAQGPTAGAGRFTLAGTVVDANNQPLPGIELSVHSANRDLPNDPVISDGQGRFAFGGLAAGEYTLWAEASGFGTVRYGETPDPQSVSSIRLGGEVGDKSVVFRLLPRGTIEGTIRDEVGDPMSRVNVSILRPVWRNGRTTTAYAGMKSTDDRGRYRFGNLAPGNYVVCAAGGGQNTTAPLPGPVDFATHVDNRIYGRTCNRAFPLSPGQHAQVDVSPIAMQAATVRGHVRNLPPQTGFAVDLRSDDEYQGINTMLNGIVDFGVAAFTIRGVLPGRYRLHAQVFANGNSRPLSTELPLEVGSSDIDGLDVDLASQASVDVVFQGLSEDQLKETSALLRNADPSATLWGPTQTKDGDFQFQGLPPGRYRLKLDPPPDSCIASVSLGEREMRGSAFDVASGSALRLGVALSQSCGGIRMRALRDGSPVPRAKVVLLASGTPQDPGDLIEESTDDGGEFTFSGLTPGKYLVWAWAVEGPGAITGPSSLAAVAQQAVTVDVAAGDPVKVDVPLLADEGKGQ